MIDMTASTFARFAVIAAMHAGALAALTSVRLDTVLVFAVLHIGCTGVGGSLFLHRYATHRSFRAGPVFRAIGAVFAALKLQGGIARWVAYHRMHHAHSGEVRDPYGTHLGFWYSHILWVLADKRPLDRLIPSYARDITQDRFLMLFEPLPVQLALQAALASALYVWGGVDYVLWGVCLRATLGYHTVGVLNSLSHMRRLPFAYENYPREDDSNNHPAVALVTFGEGWHNNHHAFPSAANHGFHRPWEVDPSYLAIHLLARCGLVTDVKTANLNQLPSGSVPAALSFVSIPEERGSEPSRRG